MSFDYQYIRGHLEDGRFDINNPLRVDETGSQIYLTDEVFTTLELSNTIHCNNDVCIVRFSVELSTAQKETLDTIVYNHKNNI